MSMKYFAIAALAALTSASAVETKTWTQSEAAEFDKGTFKGLSLRSDGRVMLAPVFQELHDPAVPHLWAVAAAPDGTAYAAGAEGKVFVIGKDGKGRLLATLDGGAVYALAVGTKNDLFAAVSPDAKIYRISQDGRATLFHSSKAKYVWALVAGSDGSLYAGTGEPGQIHRIAADGQATVLYEAGESHVRSLARAANGDFYAGTEPGGMIVRVSPTGQGFVLHQTSKREVTALAVGADGVLWAAASGRKGTGAPVPPPVTVPPQPAPPSGAAVQPAAPRPVVAPPPSLALAAGVVTGGSEVWKILPDGEPRLAWSNPTEIAYSLAVGADGKPVVGTGNQGYLFRVESDSLSTRLIDAEPAQITALGVLPTGGFLAAAANPGRIYRLGPQLEKEGAVESELFDANAFTYWGRLRYEAALNGGSIRMETRSGNVDRADRNWSPWAAATDRIVSPAARFLNWRASLTAAPNGASPELSLVEVAYQQKNAAPSVEAIEITPPNYRFSGGSSLTASSSTLTLPPIGQKRRSSPSTPASQPAGTATMNYAKGSLGARWKASDPNGDSLEFLLEIRGLEESEWKPLKKELTENRFSWDSDRFADGRYLLRVTASDQPDNYPGQGLSAQAQSEPFLVDNTPPAISGLAARQENGKLVIRFHAEDTLSSLASAEYSLNGGDWIAVPPSTRMTDSLAHDYATEAAVPAAKEVVVAVKVADEFDNVTVQKIVVR